MKTVRGIKGIRAWLNNQAFQEGWHVHVDGKYFGYHEENAHVIFEKLYARNDKTKLEWYGGNVLMFTRKVLTRYEIEMERR